MVPPKSSSGSAPGSDTILVRAVRGGGLSSTQKQADKASKFSQCLEKLALSTYSSKMNSISKPFQRHDQVHSFFLKFQQIQIHFTLPLQTI